MVNKDAEHLSIPEEGKVKITVQNGGLWDTQNPHNVVVGEFGKDLENVTATVKVDGKTANNYDEAGLIFIKIMTIMWRLKENMGMERHRFIW